MTVLFIDSLFPKKRSIPPWGCFALIFDKKGLLVDELLTVLDDDALVTVVDALASKVVESSVAIGVASGRC